MANSYDTDVCIIGSGVAGITAARHLQKEGIDVTILESGKWENSIIDRIHYKIYDRFPQVKNLALKIPGFSYPWVDTNRDEFTNSGQREYDLNKSRHKGVGGTVGRISPIWHGWAIRPYPVDFQKKSKYGFGKDWPIDYSDLEPYYKRAEEELFVAGCNDNPYRDRDEYPIKKSPPKEIKDRFNSISTGPEIGLHTVPVATEPTSDKNSVFTTDHHISQALSRGVNIISEAVVRRLQLDEEGKKINSVNYTRDDNSHSISARHFILAAGGVEIPRLLLLSQSDHFPDGLANSSGIVGKYFMEHPMIKIEGEITNPKIDFPAGKAQNEVISHKYYSPSEEQPHSIMLIFRGKSEDDVTLMALVEMGPQEHNCVSLNDNIFDNNNDPVPDMSLSYGEGNKNALKRAETLLLDICEKFEIDVKSIRGTQDPVYPNHHIGTTRMGDDPNKSVVDQDLRTHDVRNLSIISSSVFPTGFGVNPTLTIVALSLLAVEDISSSLRQ